MEDGASTGVHSHETARMGTYYCTQEMVLTTTSLTMFALPLSADIIYGWPPGLAWLDDSVAVDRRAASPSPVAEVAEPMGDHQRTLLRKLPQDARRTPAKPIPHEILHQPEETPNRGVWYCHPGSSQLKTCWY